MTMADDSTHQGEPKRMTRDENGELVPEENGNGPGSPVARSCAQAKSHLVDALEAANPAQAYMLLNQAIQTLDEAVPEGDT